MSNPEDIFDGNVVTDERKKELKKKVTPFHDYYSGKFMMDGELDQPDYLVEDFIARQNLTNLSGPPGSAKTTLALLIAADNVSGNILNMKSKTFKTLFIDEENGAYQTKYIFRRIMESCKLFLSDEQYESAINNVGFYCMTGFRMDEFWGNELDNVISDMRNNNNCPDLIIFDNVSRIFEGDSNTQEAAKMVHRVLKPLAIKYNIGILLLSHTRKGSPETLSDISGSGDFGAQVTIAYISKLVSSNDGVASIWLRKVKNNLGVPIGDPYSFDIKGSKTDLTITYEGLVSSVMRAKNNLTDQIKTEVTTILSEHGMTWKGIMLHLINKGFNEGTSKATLNKMSGSKKSNKKMIEKDGELWINS